MIKEKVKGFFKNHWIFLCILTFAVILRLLYVSPGIRYVGTDLSLQAYNLLQGQYDLNQLWYHLGVRYVMLVLVAGIYWLFGISEFTANIIPFCASIGTIILIYFLGRFLFSKEAGLLAAFFLTILPLDIFNATILETDSTMNFFAVIAMFLYYYLRTRDMKSVYFFFVGVIIALSTLTKIFGILMLVSIGLYELWMFEYKNPERKRLVKKVFLRILYIGCGFAIIYCPILVWQYSQTGDVFYNIHVEKYLMYAIPQFKDWPKPNYDFIPLSNDWTTYPRYMFDPLKHAISDHIPEDGISPMLNIFFYGIILAGGYYCLKRNDKTTFLIFWFLIPLLFLQNYYFIVKVQRYLTITLVPGLLLLSCLISYYIFELKKIRIRYFLVGVLIIFVITFYQLGTYTFFNLPLNNIHVYSDSPLGKNQMYAVQTNEERVALILLKTFQQDNKTAPIYVTNYQMIPTLNFYLKYSMNYSGPHGYTGPTSTSIYDLHFIKNITEIHNAFIILETEYYEKDLDVYNYYMHFNGSLPPLPKKTPSYWKGIYQINIEPTTRTTNPQSIMIIYAS